MTAPPAIMEIIVPKAFGVKLLKRLMKYLTNQPTITPRDSEPIAATMLIGFPPYYVFG
jgi:hypothetical protein